MKKVRIGNDIRLVVGILANDNETLVNIKSMRAYLINVTKQNDVDQLHRLASVNYANELAERNGVVKYISRFPAEPCCAHYNSSKYDLMHCGHPSFHVRPVCGIAPYVGFGVYPHTFDPFTNQLWAYDDASDLHNKMLYKEQEYKEQYEKCLFFAPISYTEETGIINVDFPAESQLYTGVYKLVIIAKVFESGYSATNLKTITMDYNYVFELVGSNEQADEIGGAVINIGSGVQATSISSTAPSVILAGTPTEITSSVYPLNASGDVNYRIIGIEASDKTLIETSRASINKANKTGRASIYAPLDLVGAKITVEASAASNPDVKITFSMFVTDSIDSDDYVNSANFNSTANELTLTRKSGETVSVNIPNDFSWSVILNEDVAP